MSVHKIPINWKFGFYLVFIKFQVSTSIDANNSIQKEWKPDDLIFAPLYEQLRHRKLDKEEDALLETDPEVEKLLKLYVILLLFVEPIGRWFWRRNRRRMSSRCASPNETSCSASTSNFWTNPSHLWTSQLHPINLQFEDLGRYLLINNLLPMTSHNGLFGYLGKMYKNMVADHLNAGVEPLTGLFSGQGLCQLLLDHICYLNTERRPTKSQTPTTSLPAWTPWGFYCCVTATTAPKCGRPVHF
jgi:hypothetical protein